MQPDEAGLSSLVNPVPTPRSAAFRARPTPGAQDRTYLGGQGSVLQAWLMAGGRCTVSHRVSFTVCWVWVCKHTAMASCRPGGRKQGKMHMTLMKKKKERKKTES